MAERHFSMIRGFHAADLFTIANGCCGIAAILHAMQFVGGAEMHRLDMAAALVPLAAVFDVLDGRVARWRHTHSPMGRELDSLADVISFGAAPAAIAFAAGLNTLVDQIALMYFAVCGLSRLARYNITADALATESGKVRYFEGTPITTSVIPLGITIAALHAGRLFPIALGSVTFHALSLLFVISGSLMISKTIHVPKP